MCMGQAMKSGPAHTGVSKKADYYLPGNFLRPSACGGKGNLASLPLHPLQRLRVACSQVHDRQLLRSVEKIMEASSLVLLQQLLSESQQGQFAAFHCKVWTGTFL
ncbi:uncharacterized protein LOC135810304 [Sycon ciliatum]|uniref:uncharacterized protein LOC135810304 n=1 Tax=Sycon ciliatum TaxID=27933 RepID=UPI0031F6DC99